MPPRTRPVSNRRTRSGRNNLPEPQQHNEINQAVQEVAALEEGPNHNELLGLPTELVIEILRHMTPQQLLRLRRVCKRLQTIVDDTPDLTYRIELTAAGYDPEKPLTTDITSTLATFRRNQRAYRTPRIHRGKVRNLSAGLLSTDQWPSYPKIVGDIAVFTASTKDTLGVLSLGLDVPDAQRFRQLHFGFEFYKFFISASRDWVIIPEDQKLHFRSLATGDTPDDVLALGRGDLPIAEADLPDDINFYDSISLWGEWLLISVVHGEDGDRVRCLFHWPSGRMVAQFDFDDVGGFLVDGFAIIPGPNTHNSEDAANGLSVQVYKLPANVDNAQNPPRPLAVYRLPEAVDDVYNSDDFTEQSNAFCKIRPIDAAWPGSSSACDNYASLLEISFSKSTTLVVPVDTFLTDAVRGLDATASTEYFDWSKWGPLGSRFIEEGLDVEGRIVAHGACGRHLILTDRILDFNQYDLARNVYAGAAVHKLRESTQKRKQELVAAEATKLTTEDLGKDSVHIVTALPFRSLKARIPKPKADGNPFQLALLEEADGPKLVELVHLVGDWNVDQGVYGLRYHTF